MTGSIRKFLSEVFGRAPIISVVPAIDALRATVERDVIEGAKSIDSYQAATKSVLDDLSVRKRKRRVSRAH